jgi:hypothetical protein
VAIIVDKKFVVCLRGKFNGDERRQWTAYWGENSHLAFLCHINFACMIVAG